MSFSFGSIPAQKSANTTKPGTWDKPVPTVPFANDLNHGNVEHFRTLTSHPDFKNYSLEEHRFDDYKNGKGRNAVHGADFSGKNSFSPDSELLIKKTLVDRNQMGLLQGSGVEIQVGTKTTLPRWNGTKSFETWFLPANLISHYSLYAKEICSSMIQGTYQRLTLQDHQPAIFGLFVEWLYYGSYETSPVVSDSNINVQCWVLGSKLLCVEFQNYAMRRLYDQHTRPVFGRPVTCSDVRYVWSNTSPGSKLRKFFLNFIVEHFGSPVKLLGSSTDWDTILQNQSEIRISLIDKFRRSAFSPSCMQNIDEYLESKGISVSLPQQWKGQPIPLGGGANTERAPMFNFNENPSVKNDSPQKKMAFQLPSRTKNYEGASLKFGWKLEDNKDNTSSSSTKVSQLERDSSPKSNEEPIIGHADQCITSVGIPDVVGKSPETGKGKEPAKGENDNSKESELGEANI